MTLFGLTKEEWDTIDNQLAERGEPESNWRLAFCGPSSKPDELWFRWRDLARQYGREAFS